MKKCIAAFIVAAGLIAWQPALSEPDRESLLEAWAAHVARLPGTAEFEALGEDRYRLQDTDLPYDGELRIIGALVRPLEAARVDTGFSHYGMVDIELADLPAERLASQSYYYWLGDRQMLYFSDDSQQWVSSAEYQAVIAEQYEPDVSFGTLRFMLNYGIWALLIVLIAFVFIAVSRQSKKARALMDETAAINRHASENLDRSERMQDEVMAMTREMRDLQRDNNDLLRKMLEALQR